MVQGGARCGSTSELERGSRDTNSRKAGFNAVQKKVEEKKVPETKDKNGQHGAWGPLYKNKQNFVDMHIC